MRIHPEPVLSRAEGPGRRVGVLGGTFDPIHLGHLILAEAARQELALTRVIFLPAADPWRKAGRQLAPIDHRLAMVRLATTDNPCFSVSTVEVERPGPSYTADTLAVLQGELGPETELFFILGQDTLADFPYWKDPQRIMAQARLAVAQRPGWPLPSEEWLEGAVPGIVARLAPFTMPAIDISATDIRQRYRERRSIRYLVPAAVEAYIRDYNLYTEA